MKDIKKKIDGIQIMLTGLYEGGDVTEAARSSIQYTIDEAQKQLKSMGSSSSVMRYFFITFSGQGTSSGSVWFEADGHPSAVQIKEAITNKFSEVKDPAIMSVVEMNENDYKAFDYT